jgi:hypothetical protein
MNTAIKKLKQALTTSINTLALLDDLKSPIPIATKRIGAIVFDAKLTAVRATRPPGVISGDGSLKGLTRLINEYKNAITALARFGNMRTANKK